MARKDKVVDDLTKGIGFLFKKNKVTGITGAAKITKLGEVEVTDDGGTDTYTAKNILIATGSEVEIALKARDLLQAEGIGTRVVSMPCMELFAAQDEAYRRRVLPAGPVRVGVEAAVRQGWDRWLTGERGKWNKADFVGMDRFGASAPAEELFEKFDITPQNVADKAKALL